MNQVALLPWIRELKIETNTLLHQEELSWRQRSRSIYGHKLEIKIQNTFTIEPVTNVERTTYRESTTQMGFGAQRKTT